MNTEYNFSNCKRVFRTYGGSDRKEGIIYNGDVYMIKHPENHAKKSEISSSYVNSVISEYISSHIADSIGLPTHETVLGIYNDEIVVGCKDFRKASDEHIIEFSELQRIKYDSKDLRRQVILSQIYNTIYSDEVELPKDLQSKTVGRYWDTFVVDALVGNYDRHTGNWAYIEKNGELSLAPTYDYGSTLYPILAEEGMEKVLKSDYEVLQRCLVFPSPNLHITTEKVGKIGYYDMLASGYDINCTDAVLRIAPKIDLEKINNIIDNTPFISDTRKNFYKVMLAERKTFIIDRAYTRCVSQNFDKTALSRMTDGRQYTVKDLNHDLNELIGQRNYMPTPIQEEYKSLKTRQAEFHSAEYIKEKIFHSQGSPDEDSVTARISDIENTYKTATSSHRTDEKHLSPTATQER